MNEMVSHEETEFNDAGRQKRSVDEMENEENLRDEDETKAAVMSSKRTRLVGKFASNASLTLNDSENKENLAFTCELCQTVFACAISLKQHNDTVHMKKSMWQCSECKKLFTSKSNLKVHLRVHTRIKPYHCKNCSYSCMHHSSIKEHLAKLHPNVVHSSTNPAYAFNSVVVPDPDQFNSTAFDRAAFIAGAKESNEKLIAQINNSGIFQASNSNRNYTQQHHLYHHQHMHQQHSNQYNKSNSSVNISPILSASSSSSSSASSNNNSLISRSNEYNTSFEQHNESITSAHTTSSSSSSSSSSPYMNEMTSEMAHTYSSPISLNQFSKQLNQRYNTKSLTKIANKKPMSNFSISALISKSPVSSFRHEKVSKTPSLIPIESQMPMAYSNSLWSQAALLGNKNLFGMASASTSASMWSYAAQMQFFYNYFAQLQHLQGQTSTKN